VNDAPGHLFVRPQGIEIGNRTIQCGLQGASQLDRPAATLPRLNRKAFLLVNETLAREIVSFVAAARENGTGGVGKTGSDEGELTVEPALLSLVCHGLNEKRKTQGKAQWRRESTFLHARRICILTNVEMV
jgi:hypothetical protein